MVERDRPQLLCAKRETTTSIDGVAIKEILERLSGGEAERLPFHAGDVTAGSETELQAVVEGERHQVDLPLAIEQSRFFANLVKRAASGETPERCVDQLQRFLSDNPATVWENSWVRFERHRLSDYALRVLQRDLMADKGNPASGQRSDQQRFRFIAQDGSEWLRLPISYLIKLALADVIGCQPRLPEPIHATATALQKHFLNDNTSPETFSLYVVNERHGSNTGQALAREAQQRYLLTQLLIHYANEQFGLRENGQQALVYCAPHPPRRQKQLNELIPDAFYRELFMSPCLSGWDRGEDKYRYMQLCHQVLSRSQLNAVAKLREAGIITRNLVVLPNMSNISLANNGVHVSLGSRLLSEQRGQSDGLYPLAAEKACADLSIKIQEHFLPLFASSYSAAPYRLGFADFHPEKALGFLPHELDYTHLRMMWRRWRKKADLRVFGQTLTPFGPEWLDSGLSRLFRLRGDVVPDFRLVDYPVSFLSTAESPALNGVAGNQKKLLSDLDAMGVFDERMSLYQFFKAREYAGMGFSGFEGRYYSLFPSFERDMAGAVRLQQLITALSFRYMAEGRYNHRHIPDSPQCESERRQIFFGRALGLPTFFVRRNTRNRLLLRILRQTENIRHSRRYPGYLRVHQKDYCRALIAVLEQDGAELIEQLDAHDLLTDLRHRIEEPQTFSAAGQLTEDILCQSGGRSALKMEADDFNRTAEHFYRTRLRADHLRESFAMLRRELPLLEEDLRSDALLAPWVAQWSPQGLEKGCERRIRLWDHQRLRGSELLALINLVLLSIDRDRRLSSRDPLEEVNDDGLSSVYRAC
ncbi:MAG: hypothetical protein JXR59_10095 [Desulfuromonadaceae bacterium]|nr:hypothetical protein [Desulfuromonadaceae bacterium]